MPNQSQSQSQSQGQQTPLSPPVKPWLEGYQPWPGVPDELMDASGAVRPGWTGLLEHIAPLSATELGERFQRGDQYLRDAGVYFRQYGQATSQEREWPLSHIPVIIHEREWREIAAGLIQRAELLEAVVADLYGENTLVRDGHLPASLVATNAEWLRPLVGVAPASGHFLHFLAFEIGRGPGGRWWVLGDRTQAPSGAGFALENPTGDTPRRKVIGIDASFTPAQTKAQVLDIARQLKDGQLKSRDEATKKLVSDILRDQGMAHREFAEAMGTSFSGSTMWRHAPSRERLHKVATVLADADLDVVATNHDATIQVFENIDNTNFVDVTAGCGMEFNGFFLQSKFVDFDNDGFLDVLIAGGDEFLFLGNGDGTFDQVSGLFPAGRDMHSFATGDLNNDGFVDDLDFQAFVFSYNILDCSDAGMAVGCPGDFTFDRVVDDDDFLPFVQAYNAVLCP